MGGKSFVIGLILASVSISAFGSDWYLFRDWDLSCVKAQRLAQQSGDAYFASPYLMRKAMIGDPQYKDTRVFHLAPQQERVIIEVKGNREMDFFSSRDLCKMYVHYRKSLPHHVTNLNELK